ncbi:MAG: FmdE family protein [Geobacteraceae bacterium]|nr:FmdE family protein [Geobacteraceae bacterium]
MEYAEIIQFHGHSCPGLAIGFRLATAAMKALGATRSDDEELFAVVESDACGVDALQCVSGCTFGKGNLIFRDYGKHAYSLFSRVKQQGVRAVFHGKGIPAELRQDKQAFARRIMSEREDLIVSVVSIPFEDLQTARVRNSVMCASCGESVMDTRVSKAEAGYICIPCAERRQSC